MGTKHSTMTQVYKVFMYIRLFLCVFYVFSVAVTGESWDVYCVCMYTVPILKSSSLLIFVVCAALNYEYKFIIISSKICLI